MFDAANTRCVQLLSRALNDSQYASLLVSGGTTPVPLFKALSESPLAWERVCIALVDERWVEENHSASNAGLVKRTLLQNSASAAKFIGMKNSRVTAQAGSREVNEAYAEIPSPFDLLLLGMGPDGHIASLFPQSSGLTSALAVDNENLCCAIQAQQSEVAGEYTERMSLTLKGILQARQIILLITGEDKLAVYQRGLSDSCIESLPVSAVLQQRQTPVDIYWAP